MCHRTRRGAPVNLPFQHKGDNLKYENLAEFKARYAKFQKIHMRIIFVFVFILAVQVVLSFVYPLPKIFPGHQNLILLGIQILLFFIASKIHEKLDPLTCPKCKNSLAYKFGKEVINTNMCPHCFKNVIDVAP
jgi:hypothetical protein